MGLKSDSGNSNMAAMVPLHFVRRLHLYENRPERRIRDRENPLELYTEKGFQERYRFSKETVIFFLEIFNETLERATRRSSALPPIIQFCCFLRFLACGSFQITVGDAESISKASVHRVCKALLDVIPAFLDDIVKFPTSEQEKALVKRKFYDIAGR